MAYVRNKMALSVPFMKPKNFQQLDATCIWELVYRSQIPTGQLHSPQKIGMGYHNDIKFRRIPKNMITTNTHTCLLLNIKNVYPVPIFY